jgi:phosphatidate cytidylyltransferase
VRFPAVTNQETAGICFASTYLGLSLAHFLLLRAMDNGFALTLVAFLLTWVFDSTAYFVGMRLGKHRLAPRLSPGKSWEGAVGGSIAALAFAAAPFPFWSPRLTLRLAAAVSVIVFGQIGDLAESTMKRHAQVKDSGRVLPGHGGMLDRFDSLMLSLPAVYYLFRLLPGGLGR